MFVPLVNGMARNLYLANIMENGNSGHFAEQRINVEQRNQAADDARRSGRPLLTYRYFLKFQQSFTVYCA